MFEQSEGKENKMCPTTGRAQKNASHIKSNMLSTYKRTYSQSSVSLQKRGEEIATEKEQNRAARNLRLCHLVAQLFSSLVSFFSFQRLPPHPQECICATLKTCQMIFYSDQNMKVRATSVEITAHRSTFCFHYYYCDYCVMFGCAGTCNTSWRPPLRSVSLRRLLSM